MNAFKNKRLSFIALVGITLWAFLCTSCSVGRFLKDDEKVLFRNKFDIVMCDGSTPSKELKRYARQGNRYVKQQSNKRFLIFGRQSLGIYCLSSPNDSNWLNRTLRNIGEAPVVFDDEAARQTTVQLNEMIKSKGCLNSFVDYQIIDRNKYSVNILYTIHASKRYKIDDIEYEVETPEIFPLLKQWQESSYLQIGDYFDQDNFAAERDRIVENLQNNGYYLTSRDLVYFYIDTSYSEELLSIKIKINNPQVVDSSGTVTKRPLQKYYINTITIDSNAVNNYVLRRTINMVPGQLYRPKSVSSSYNSLLNLRNFKYINIDFYEDSASTDSVRLLASHIHLLNNSQQKISASLEITNASPVEKKESGNYLTNGNFGIETVLSYQHKNIFGGAEMLTVEGNLLVELPKMVFSQKSNDFYSTFSAFEAGLTTTLDLPTFLLPFSNKLSLRHYRPHTLISIGGNYQYRSYFEREQFSSSFGYTWNVNPRTQYRLTPIEISYVRYLNISDEFWERFSDNFYNFYFLSQYSNHFTPCARLEFIFNNQRFGTRQDFSYIHATLESAGNLMAAICTAYQKPNAGGLYELLGVPYAQYIRLWGEAKHYFYQGDKSTFVIRGIFGLGIPYGNSYTLPYEKSFFGSGPTTIRAWQTRRLGPGSYNKTNDDFDYDQYGDISIVLNLEERFTIAGPVEGALFADLGNIWRTTRSTIDNDGEIFHWNTFLKEIAIGAGLGIRLKISILTVRLDFAIPIYDPGVDPSERWRFSHWKFNQIVTNFGIDYPF